MTNDRDFESAALAAKIMCIVAPMSLVGAIGAACLMSFMPASIAVLCSAVVMYLVGLWSAQAAARRTKGLVWAKIAKWALIVPGRVGIVFAFIFGAMSAMLFGHL
jgi:hypothetical protein